MIRKFLFLFSIFFVVFSFAATKEKNLTEDEKILLLDIDDQIKKIDSMIGEKNIWIKRFYDHQGYLNLQDELKEAERQLKLLSRKTDAVSKDKSVNISAKIQTIESKISLIGESVATPFESLIKIEPLPDTPEIKNPLAIIGALSFIKENQKVIEEYKSREKNLRSTLELISEKRVLQEQKTALLAVEDRASALKNAELLKETHQIETTLSNALDLYSTAINVQEKRFNTSVQQVESNIKKEVMKLINISITIAIIVAISFVLKYLALRALNDATRLYGIKRTINTILFFVIMLIILFNYISNIVYFVTLLGFISAGIAIAMKDWFMSLLGWLVMTMGGSIKIGDRIRFIYQNETLVGDVLEVGLTRITFFVDVSLGTVEETRRAGQIVYMPNNFIFTQVIQNFTYGKLKTIWDGIDIVVSFDSNHEKAQKIAKEIAAKHTSGFMNITRKHYANLRERFNLRIISHEPRVFALVHTYGVRISIWYLASSYGTLSLRSIISTEIIEAYLNEEDIKIAYPTYTLAKSGELGEFVPVKSL